jgi:hypothetical protein
LKWKLANIDTAWPLVDEVVVGATNFVIGLTATVSVALAFPTDIDAAWLLASCVSL